MRAHSMQLSVVVTLAAALFVARDVRAQAASTEGITPVVQPPVTCPLPAPAKKSKRLTVSTEPTGACYSRGGWPDQQCMVGKQLCASDLEIAKIAWKYYENNYQPKTGLVNSNDNFPSTTLWDTASAFAAFVAAKEFGLIDDKTFDDKIVTAFSTLSTMKLFRNIAPNKAYNTITAEMTDYLNKPTEGIGYSALDVSRLISWLEVIACTHPKHAAAARKIMERWDLCQLTENGEMQGAFVDPASKALKKIQEGRTGYEQYGGKGFQLLGFDQATASNYRNPYLQTVNIYGVEVPYDIRDPRKLGAYNFVVTESYALDALEFGVDEQNAPFVAAIYEVQRRRWQETGIVTAVSEDNVDRPPYFVYNTIFAAGTPWNTLTDQGKDQSALKSTSTKAAFSLATLFPNEPYSAVLIDKIISANDPKRGWYSGIYESGIGYNKSITANTNGIILEAMLYKTLGPLHQRCAKCHRNRKPEMNANILAKCPIKPGQACASCQAKVAR